jgi:hypothetical protein
MKPISAHVARRRPRIEKGIAKACLLTHPGRPSLALAWLVTLASLASRGDPSYGDGSARLSSDLLERPPRLSPRLALLSRSRPRLRPRHPRTRRSECDLRDRPLANPQGRPRPRLRLRRPEVRGEVLRRGTRSHTHSGAPGGAGHVPARRDRLQHEGMVTR